MSCKITEAEIDGMRALYLENDLLKIGILVDRGSDIFEFRHKPKDIDFLLRLSKGIRNPQTHFSQIRNTKSQFEDYYYGGWQICLPNSPAFNYRGAELGQHGEVSLIPWEVKILDESAERISITCSAQPLRIPIKIERTFSISKNSIDLMIEERVSNVGKTHLDIMWGQHIAFGLPFLEEGVTIQTNAKTMKTEPTMPEHHRFKRGEAYAWPNAKSKKGTRDDASVVTAKGVEQYSDLCYLEGYGAKAFYAIRNEKRNVGFSLRWDGELFKNLWYWQERNATKDFPWWGDCYTVALEPWTSQWTNQPHEAIKNKEWLTIDAGSTIKTSFVASAFENEFKSE
jgi:galactose mutarotase-like enzyme